MRTALCLDPRFTEHRGAADNPERPERIARLLPILDRPGRSGIVSIEPRAATADELHSVHTSEHCERVARSDGLERTVFDEDTETGPHSYRTALLAAGGVVEVIDAVKDGHADNGLALVRPPGHHAERDRVMGFCLFNNVAVGAAHLRRSGFDRVAVVDWDVHHGNGTQHIFWADPSVFFVSLHQFPLYPGTGRAEERGSGEGAGATLNIPMPPGGGDVEYLMVMEEKVLPALREFAPDFLLVSAGFDAHQRDPLAAMNVSTTAFAEMTRMLMRAAGELCSGRLVLVLEGGYDLHALEDGVRAVFQELGRKEETP